MTRFGGGAGPELGVAERIGGLEGEGAFAIAAAARALGDAGRDVISLAIGEPDFPTPPDVVDAAARALRDGAYRYGPPEGLAALRDAIAESLTRYDVPADPQGIIVTPGAKAALAYALLCVVRPGDEVLVPDPGFPIYASLVRFAGGVPVRYAVHSWGEPLPDDLTLARLGSRTRAVIVNSPHNPTGTVASAAGLARLAAAAERYDLAVISDEVYARLVHVPDDPGTTVPPRAPSIASVPDLASRTIVIDGFSKTYAMTGWRLGYGVFPPALSRAAALLAVNVHSCVPAFVQLAGLAALATADAIVRERRAELRRRRDDAFGALREIPGVSCAEPGGAFYVFPQIVELLRETGESSSGFAARLLRDAHVALLPGSAFGPGGEGSLRLALTVDRARQREAIGRLAACVAGGSSSRTAHRTRTIRAGVSSGGAA